MSRILFFLLLLLASISYAQPSSQKAARPYVVLVSFDGFRYDYVTRFNLPNFKSFIRTGAAADALIPSFPSKTFPNHYTLVTGLYPGNHGLVDNYFYDPASKKKYSMRDPQAVHDQSFYGGVPLWQLAQQQGVRTASYFWVGSETKIQGMLPDHFLIYDEKVPNPKRIEQTLSWLTLPEPERPHFISLYFSLVDTEGHNSGPDSEALKQTVMNADSLLGNLMAGLHALNLPVNVVLVSDHGMYGLNQADNSYITLANYLNLADTSMVVSNGGTQAFVYTAKADSLYDVLKKSASHFTVYKPSEIPAAWHYSNARTGDLMLVVDLGYYFRLTKPQGIKPTQHPTFGVHGYDPYTVPEMRGIFYANGPAIRPGSHVGPINNVNVYPFIAEILGLTIPPIDGDPAVLRPLLKDQKRKK